MERETRTDSRPKRATEYFDKQEIDQLLPKDDTHHASSDNGIHESVNGMRVYLDRIGLFPLLNAQQEILIMQAYAQEKAAEQDADDQLLSKLATDHQREVAKAVLSRDITGSRKHKTHEDVAKEAAKNGVSLEPEEVPGIEGEIVDILTEFCTPEQLAQQKEKNRQISDIDAIFQAKRKESRDTVSPLKELRKEGSAFQSSIDPDLQEKFDFALSESDSAMDLMINCNLRLVIDLASKTRREALTHDDRIQAAWFGLKRAVEKFDITQGYKFSTYASYWIMQSIQKEVIDTDNMIRIPANLLAMVNKVDKTISTVTNKLCRTPTREELLDHLPSTPDKIEETKRAIGIFFSQKYNTLSLNQTVDETAAELGDLLPDDNNFEDAVISEQTTNVIDHALSLLKPREQHVILLRAEEDPMSFDAIGKLYGVTRERIRQVELTARGKLQNHPIIKNLWEEHYPSNGNPSAESPKPQKATLTTVFADKSADEIRAIMQGQTALKQKIVELRLGLDRGGEQGRTVTEVAELLGVSPQSINTAEGKLVKRLAESENARRKKASRYKDHPRKQTKEYPPEPAIQVYSIDRPPTPDKTRKSQQEKDMDAISGIFTKAEAEGGKEAVMELLKKLPQRERRAIMSRLGLDDKGTKTQAQTAKATGIYWPYERSVLNILTQPEEPNGNTVTP